MKARLSRIRQCRRLVATIAAVAALVTLLPVAWAQEPQTEIPFDPEVRRGTLGNGLTYYVKVNPEPPDRIQLRLGVRAGSVLEQESERGLAHFLEHMAFNGTDSFAGNEIIDYLESIGSAFGPDLNAYTSFDETVYLLELPTDADVVAKGFDILSEWAYAITLDPDEVERERGVVLEEWRLGQGADQRIRDQPVPGAVRRLPILGAVADRPAGDHRDRIRRRPARLLRALVSAGPHGGGRGRRSRSGRDGSPDPRALRAAAGGHGGLSEGLPPRSADRSNAVPRPPRTRISGSAWPPIPR